MRLLLAGAFLYPHQQGSQVYFQEQAIALRAAGAEVHLLTYGPGRRRDPLDRGRALDGFAHTAIPAWSAPTSPRSGPNLEKALADVCLAAALRRACADASTAASSKPGASSASAPASRRASPEALASAARPPDAVLAHHAEAALAALHALGGARPPVVYCAHTLLGEELPSYLDPSSSNRFLAPNQRLAADSSEARSAGFERSRIGRGVATIGRAIDRWIARRAQGWIALTQSTARVMSASSSAPGRLIGPPVAYPAPECASIDAAALARSHGLTPGRFFLYAGNLDPYQELALLERVARERACRGAAADPIVIATHDDRAPRIPPTRDRSAGLDLVRVGTDAEMRALVSVARATVVTRRGLGGFPIKLVNSLAAGTPAVVFLGEEWGLESGRDSLVCDPTRPVESLAGALARLERDEGLALRLRAGARATWVARHRPEQAAAETLALIDEVIGRRRSGR